MNPQIKNQIQQALDSLPLGIQYRHIQSHLIMALNEIKKIEKAKVNKKKPQQENKKFVFNKNALNAIENMIEEEYKN